MPLKIGNYTLTGHQGLAIEKLRARVVTGSSDPVLKPRSGGVCSLPSLNIRRTQALRDSAAVPAADSSQPANRVRIFPKWKAEDRFILSFADDDKVIRQGAAVQAIDHGVPASNCFHSASKRTKGGTGSLISPNSLASLTEAHRLDLHAYGDSEYVGEMTPWQLAVRLHQAGLRSVGVLKIQACNTGTGNYLEQLKHEFNELGVKVGYLSGPQGTVGDPRIPVKLGNKKFTVNPVRALAVIAPIPLGASLFANKVVNWVIPEPMALKVVKGNTNVAFPGTRYSLHAGAPLPDVGT